MFAQISKFYTYLCCSLKSLGIGQMGKILVAYLNNVHKQVFVRGCLGAHFYTPMSQLWMIGGWEVHIISVILWSEFGQRPVASVRPEILPASAYFSKYGVGRE